MRMLEELTWIRCASAIQQAGLGSLKPLRSLGRRRQNRHTWLAEGGAGRLVVKATLIPPGSDRAAWTSEVLTILRDRGYPAPQVRWSGRLDATWQLVVEQWLPGRALGRLDRALLGDLIRLVDLQASSGQPLPPGGWDVSWWLGVILFEGWEGWWDAAIEAVPATAGRLRRFLEPAWGHRLPSVDIVHGDLNPTNVLVERARVSGIVDWDHVGIGSRVVDLASLLLETQRLKVSAPARVEPGGGARLTERIEQIAGRD